MIRKNGLLSIFFLGLATQSVAYGSDVEDEHIRQIVQSLLKEKDRKIEQLEARIQQLEGEQHNSTAVQNQNPASHAATVMPEPAKTALTGKIEPAVSSKLQDLDKKIDALKEAASDSGLEVSSFFDVNAKTGNSTDQTFSVGSVELDLDYVYDEHFGASSALVLCGNSSNADYSAPVAITCGNSGPGGLSGGSTAAGIAVALIDYHLFNDRIPPRGRIFNNQGLHIQAGRFDLPFGTDYQNFANKDRITVTAPLTTSRMQLGGYNGDGVRSYGAWGLFNYSVFWTDAMYADDGHAIGGRLGMALGQRAYSVHNPNQDGIEFGVSHLSELDGGNHIRNTVYGADLSIGYGMLRLQNEVMLLQAHQGLTVAAESNPVLDDFGNPIGKVHQLGYHATLIANLENVVKHPILAFARFSRWQPKQDFGLDFDGSRVAIGDISMLSVGFNYKFNDHLRLKFEYNNSLGTSIAEQYFDKKLAIGQMVIAF
ncbi:hypothetical protein [Methylobacter sp.]|uniref:hypothetical protein n=1 Tax=Methylobacter sp. TaxID=2051955 RepID=UPI002FDD9D41